MRSQPPPTSVLEAFRVAGDPLTSLAGGEGRAWRVGAVVLKPVDEPAEWAWLGRILPTVEPNGFRLAPPFPAIDGRWVIDGWGAQPFIEGDHAERWRDVLAVGDRFHRAVAHVPKPTFVDGRTHPYAVADRVAWAEAASPVASPILDELVALRRPILSPSQLVHGDLTENVLFDVGSTPGIIDVSPYYRPPGYAAGIVIGDAMRWRGADPAPMLDVASHHAELPQLVLRASIFRLVVAKLFDPGREDEFEPDLVLARDLAG